MSDASAPRESAHRSGYVAILGRPNVGKSTLLNQVLGRKIAAVTPKPQTTRRRLLGIKTLPAAQILFFDTPGIHQPRDLMNERMVALAKQSLADADLALWLLDASAALETADRNIAEWLRTVSLPVKVALNKIDRVQKNQLLPLMAEIATLLPDCEIIPISALTGESIEVLLQVIVAALPEGPAYYPGDEITDESERGIVAEIVREKVMLETRDEVPYAVAVTIDTFEEKPEKQLVVINATIHVERESQKPIVIGNRGTRIKRIGQLARADIEELLSCRVFLELFVRVQPGWTKQLARLREFGL